ncbi:hypothetical protein [Melittangium boletus]|uniref:hypothetical protein n=1 Tax=Melittangium boletus TaxID=83453 RepID=UPI003DA2F3DA
MHRNRGLVLAALILNGLLLPFAVLSLALLLALPFKGLMSVDFELTNDTARPMRVFPVGTTGEARRIGLDTVLSRRFPLRSLQRDGYVLAPGESRTLTYDRDDMRLSELVIEREGQPVMQFVTEPERAARIKAAPKGTQVDYTPIPPAYTLTEARLEALAPEVARALEEVRTHAPEAGSFASAAWFLPLLLWPSFGVLRRTYRRMKASPV